MTVRLQIQGMYCKSEMGKLRQSSTAQPVVLGSRMAEFSFAQGTLSQCVPCHCISKRGTAQCRRCWACEGGTVQAKKKWALVGSYTSLNAVCSPSNYTSKWNWELVHFAHVLTQCLSTENELGTSMKISLGGSDAQVNCGSVIPFGSYLAFLDISGSSIVTTGRTRIVI